MFYKRLISFIIILLFIFVLSFTKNIKADDDDIVVAVPTSAQNDTGNKGEQEGEETKRTQSIFEVNTGADAWGRTYVDFFGAPDIGFGEVVEGRTYKDPLTGASYSYQTTSMGMGAIAAPVYGGLQSQYGAASYGPLAQTGGQAPLAPLTPGFDTKTSSGGSAFGDAFTYTASQPNLNAIMANTLIGNPATAGLGYLMALQGGALSGYGRGGFSTTVGSGFGGLGGNLGSSGALGGINVGSPTNFGFGRPGTAQTYPSAAISPYQAIPQQQSPFGMPYASSSQFVQPQSPYGVYANPYQYRQPQFSYSPITSSAYAPISQQYPYGAGATRLPYTTNPQQYAPQSPVYQQPDVYPAQGQQQSQQCEQTETGEVWCRQPNPGPNEECVLLENNETWCRQQ